MFCNFVPNCLISNRTCSIEIILHGTYHRSTCKDVNVKKAADLVKSLKPH